MHSKRSTALVNSQIGNNKRVWLTEAGCPLPDCPFAGLRPLRARSEGAACRVCSGFAAPLEDARRRTAVWWLCRQIVVGSGRSKKGFGVDDRLTRQTPPTLGLQGAPPAPGATVRHAVLSELTRVLRPLRVRGGRDGSQAWKAHPGEGEKGHARDAAEHARAGCVPVQPRWGDPMASPRPPLLGGPTRTNGTASGGRGGATRSLATRACPAEQRQQRDGHKGGHPRLQWGGCHDVILRHVVRWDPRGAQGGVDEKSRPRADSECALRKHARVARVF